MMMTIPTVSDRNRSGFALMSALLGGGFWGAMLVASIAGREGLGVIELLLLLALLVVVPLGFDLAAAPDAEGNNSPLYRIARFLQPAGACCAAISFLLPTGLWSALLACGWGSVAGLMALFGVFRLYRRRNFSIEELCVDAALLYIPVGSAWLIAARAGIPVAGFGGVMAMLTAVHFHYAGFIAPIITGMTGRALRTGPPRAWKVYRLAAPGVIAGPPLVALGITFSPAVEVAAAAVLALALAVHAGLLLFSVLPRLAAGPARWLLGTAACASVGAMILAVLYAIGVFSEISIIDIPRMALLHGCLNGLFALGGLSGWNIVRPAASPRNL